MPLRFCGSSGAPVDAAAAKTLVQQASASAAAEPLLVFMSREFNRALLRCGCPQSRDGSHVDWHVNTPWVMRYLGPLTEEKEEELRDQFQMARTIVILLGALKVVNPRPKLTGTGR